MTKQYNSGFVTIIGRPNVGKSTFLNQVLGQKIAIMSNKPQTTRNKIHGVLTNENSQIVFIDTPGVHKPKHKLGTYMNDIALKSLREIDGILFIVPANEEFGAGDNYILEHLKKLKVPVILVINKIDLIKNKEDLLLLIDKYSKMHDFANIVPISALNGKNVDRLIGVINDLLPEGPQYYPADQVTDHPEQFIVSELIREKVLHLTREEIPHSVAVIIEQMSKREDKEIVDVHATVIVERPSQKGIIIGKQGDMLKKVGSLARTDIQNLLGSKVFLELWVRVEKDWRNKQRYLNEFGYRDTNY